MSKNCVDIVRPFAEAVSGTDVVQIIGGVGSAALTDPRTEIVSREKAVIAPAGLYLPQRRPDGNLRDFDALVMSTDSEAVAVYEEMAETYIGDELELSFFGLRPASQLEKQRRQPIRSAAGIFLADRYATIQDSQITEAYKALYPFVVEMHPQTLESWQLYIGENDKYPIPIPHPGTTILNYLTRSVSGLRPKDAKKVGEMAEFVTTKAPEIGDWMVKGPGASQMHLARILNQVGNKGRAIELVAGGEEKPAINLGELGLETVNHMPNELNFAQSALVLGLTVAKARTLRWFESQDWIVTAWQRHGGEKLAEGTIKNK